MWSIKRSNQDNRSWSKGNGRFITALETARLKNINNSLNARLSIYKFAFLATRTLVQPYKREAVTPRLS